MKFFASLATAAALFAAVPAFAQQPAAPRAQPVPEWTEADARAVLNARLAALRTVAELTPEQERLWAPVEASIREIGRNAATRRSDRARAGEPDSFLDVLAAIATAEETRARDLRRFVDAARPFVAALTPAQQRRLPAFLGMSDHGPVAQPSVTLWLFEEEEG